MFRIVANKNGTIEVNGNEFRFNQPVEDYETEDTIEIENSYRRKLEYIGDDPHYITAHNTELRNGQFYFEFSIDGLKMFDYLRTLFLEEKLYYYRSLIEIAKRDHRGEITPLWVKENIVADTYDKSMKTLVIEHDSFKIQEKKEPTAAIKELIIISLTSMNRVLGKPRRADFLEQTDEVIHFAEKIYLKSRSIEEIEDHINAEIYQLEMRIKQEESEENNKGKLTVFKDKLFANMSNKIKLKKDKSNQELIDELEKNSPSNEPKKKLTKKEKDKRLLIISAVVIVGAIGINVMLNNLNDGASANVDEEKSEENKTEEIEQVEDDADQDEEIIEIYREVFFEDSDSTIERLEEIGYDNLENVRDKDILVQLYIEAGEIEQALEYNPGATDQVVKHLYDTQEVEALNDFVNSMETEATPDITFYQAIANGEWELAIEQKDSLVLDEQKANLLLTAFLRSENMDGANELIETIESTEDMENRVDLASGIMVQINDLNDNLSDLKDDLDDADDDDEEDDINDDISDIEDEIEELRTELQSI